MRLPHVVKCVFKHPVIFIIIIIIIIIIITIIIFVEVHFSVQVYTQILSITVAHKPLLAFPQEGAQRSSDFYPKIPGASTWTSDLCPD